MIRIQKHFIAYPSAISIMFYYLEIELAETKTITMKPSPCPALYQLSNCGHLFESHDYCFMSPPKAKNRENALLAHVQYNGNNGAH